MSTEWNPPEDDAEFAAWMDNFLEKLPQYAPQVGISEAEIQQLRKGHAEFRAAFLKEIRAQLDGLRRRLGAFRPKEQWPAVLAEAFARLPITREPDRSELLRLLGKWTSGIERAQGAALRPVLNWRYFAEGIDLGFTIPKPCEGTTVYYRQKGRAAWNFLITNTQPCKRLFTAPEYLEQAGRQEWLGKTLEFVACGWFEQASFGYPSDPVAVVVPTAYPIAGTAPC